MLWNILRTVSKGAYTYAVVPDHPHATKNGYVLEHRIVMENHLGRLLTDDEEVHHKDENGKNNALDNLEVKSKSQHHRDHGLAKGRKHAELICPGCDKVFIRFKNRTFLQNGTKWTACSYRCRSVFSRRLQLEGMTDENKLRIDRNLVREYRDVSVAQ